MGPFSLWQLGWLGSIAALSTSLAILCRREVLSHAAIRYFIATVLVAAELQRFFAEGIHFPDRMPFYLCNVTTWSAVIACLTLASPAVEFAYFAGLIAPGMALLTPDLGSPQPVPFFLNHGGVLVAAIVLMFGGTIRPRPGAPFRAYVMMVSYFICAGLFDLSWGTNYTFFRKKPNVASLLNYMGPSPVYWFTGAGLAALLVWLLWLPVRHRTATRSEEPTVAFLPEADTLATTQQSD